MTINRFGDTSLEFMTLDESEGFATRVGDTSLDFITIDPSEFADLRPDKARNADGTWGNEGGAKSKGSKGLLKAASKEDLPKHIKDLNPPPAWTDLRYNEDPDGDLLLVGKDAAGRDQYIYSERFADTKAQEKFDRVKAMDSKQGEISSQISKDMAPGSKKDKENAACAELIRQTGIRPGSDADTKAKVKAFGATTLRGEHVIVEGDKVHLEYTGKKGVSLNIPIEDRALANELISRKALAGDSGRLFNTDDKRLRDYTGTLNGGDFHPKDFRTQVATTTANDLVKSMPAPKNEKEYKKAVTNVAKGVAAKLGNTPKVALQSYISPAVFSRWRSAI
jgi:DNA topoisomerase-1